jgi:hypothetical protein
MIQHTVAFSLKHAANSKGETEFLAAADVLMTIPGVQKFKKCRQVSAKNPYQFWFTMFFADQAAYDFYNNHPLHVDFVQNRWMKEVTAFQEADFVLL